MKMLQLAIISTLLISAECVLSDADCADTTTFADTTGEEEVFSLTPWSRYSDDENETNDFYCRVNDKVPDTCQALIVTSGYLNVTQLYINGVPQTDANNVTSKNGSDVKTFTFTLSYELHNNVTVTCGTSITPQLRLISNTKTISKVDEFHHLVLNSSHTRVRAGQSYTLTCTAENERGRDVAKWYRAVNDQLSSSLLCGEEVDEGEDKIEDCSEEIEDKPPSRVITMKTDSSVNSEVTYTYFCSADEGSYHAMKQESARITVTVVPIDKKWVKAVIGVSVVVVIVAIVVVSVEWRRRKRLRHALVISRQMASVRPSASYEPVEGMALLSPALVTLNLIRERIVRKHGLWLIDSQAVLAKEQIGMGNFGMVFSGVMPNEHGIITNVAIKKIKDENLDERSLLDFEKEIDMMVSIRHDYIVDLLGICIVPNICIITELMEYGQLDSYLVRFSPTPNNPAGGIPVPVLAHMCQQPCEALDYLSSRELVHRDVSARNCLVGGNCLVKLADFGLSRDTSGSSSNYYMKMGGEVPVKWMSPEALTFGRYTTNSDVWAFGVLCWEIFTFGDQPYADYGSDEVAIKVCAGFRLDKPPLCPPQLWDVIFKCWEDAPDDRITFSALSAYLADAANEVSY